MLSLIAKLAAIQSIYFVLLMFSSRLMQSFQMELFRFIKGTDWPLWSERIQPVFTFALVSLHSPRLGPFFHSLHSSQLQRFTHLVLVDDDEDEVEIKR